MLIKILWFCCELFARFHILDAILVSTNKVLVFYFGTERIFEDHENLVENLLNWTRDSQNRLMFMERIEKYALFKNPQVRLKDTEVGIFKCLYCSLIAKLVELKNWQPPGWNTVVVKPHGSIHCC